mgnify:CR=1 FL=1|tara:strand:+ start:206 stop:1972 length:1767 start_codon:yes stop_codon:yes gene_type:complete
MYGYNEFENESFLFCESEDTPKECKGKGHITLSMWQDSQGKEMATMDTEYKDAPSVKNEPEYIAVIYIRWLKWIDPSEPLCNIPYIGQAVRSAMKYKDAKHVAQARWTEENKQSEKEDKERGLIAALEMFGIHAFYDVIVEQRKGPRSQVQKWANEREIALIAQYGGVLSDPSSSCKQTLNLTKGGQGIIDFDSKDATRTIKWVKFQRELEEYIACYKTSLVPQDYVSDSGYPLGKRVNKVRTGSLWTGHSKEAEMLAWLRGKPDWNRDGRKTEEYRQAASKLKLDAAESRQASILNAIEDETERDKYIHAVVLEKRSTDHRKQKAEYLRAERSEHESINIRKALVDYVFLRSDPGDANSALVPTKKTEEAISDHRKQHNMAISRAKSTETAKQAQSIRRHNEAQEKRDLKRMEMETEEEQFAFDKACARTDRAGNLLRKKVDALRVTFPEFKDLTFCILASMVKNYNYFPVDSSDPNSKLRPEKKTDDGDLRAKRKDVVYKSTAEKRAAHRLTLTTDEERKAWDIQCATVDRNSNLKKRKEDAIIHLEIPEFMGIKRQCLQSHFKKFLFTLTDPSDKQGELSAALKS